MQRVAALLNEEWGVEGEELEQSGTSGLTRTPLRGEKWWVVDVVDRRVLGYDVVSRQLSVGSKASQQLGIDGRAVSFIRCVREMRLASKHVNGAGPVKMCHISEIHWIL